LKKSKSNMSEQNLILQQLHKMEDKIDNLASELHNTNLEMTRIAGMKHALNDIKIWKENIEGIVNAEDLREMKRALQEVKIAAEDMDNVEKEIETLKLEKLKDRKEIDDLNTFKTKAKTVVAIISVLFTIAITVIGFFLS